MKERYYYRNIGDLPARLREAVPQDEVRAVHAIDPRRHLLWASRQVVLYAACAVTLFLVDDPWIWVPVAALQGVLILGFLILLHDHVHGLIFTGKRPRTMRLLGLLYALPSAISATQFDLWHNDHHRELGSSSDDPKRAHLSPKRVARWYKALYFTAGLFVIYAIAAHREARTYDAATRRRIALERLAAIAIHLGFAAWLWQAGGWGAVARVWAVPLFVFFPPAFFINRLGQHYDIDPSDVAKWSTLVNGNPLIRFLFLNSNHHIEHHYFPAVPMYHLPRLNRALQPFFAAQGIENRTYGRLLWGWLARNEIPHTKWGSPVESA